MSIPPDRLQRARNEAKRRLVARAAVYLSDMREAVAVAQEHLDSLKDGGDEWDAVHGMIGTVYELPERVDTTGLFENYVVFKITDLKMRDTVERIAKQFGLLEA